MNDSELMDAEDEEPKVNLFHLPWHFYMVGEKGVLFYAIDNSLGNTVACAKNYDDAVFICNCINSILKHKKNRD